MADTNDGDILRISARMTSVIHGDLVNVYHYRCNPDSGGSLTDAVTLVQAGQLMEDLYEDLDDVMCEEYSFADINVFNVTQDRPLGSTTWPTLTDGDLADDPLPSTVAAFVQLPTGFSRVWGRKFFGGLSEVNNTTTGRISSGLQSALADAAATILAGWTSPTSDEWTSVIWSTKYGDWLELTSAIIGNVWATIRRRRIGKGS